MTMVPHPLVSFVIAVLWLILTGVTPGQMVLAVLVGLVAGAAFGKLTAERVRVRRPGLMLLLAGNAPPPSASVEVQLSGARSARGIAAKGA